MRNARERERLRKPEGKDLRVDWKLIYKLIWMWNGFVHWG
jgi:hypothetical protein